MTFPELITDFASRLGMTLESTPDGVYTFDVEGMAFAIHDLSTVDAVAFTGDLGQPPPENPEGLYRLALEAQYLFQNTQGATLSINPENGNFTLCRTLGLTALDVESFFVAAEQFVNTLEVWGKIVQNYRAIVAQPSNAEDEATLNPGLFSDFLRA